MSLNPRKWLWNILIGLDQLGNTLIGGAPDETISARAGRYQGKVWYWTWLSKVLNWIEPGHTANAIQAEKEKRQQDPSYRAGDPPVSKAPKGDQS